jgi:hypothetical protein
MDYARKLGMIQGPKLWQNIIASGTNSELCTVLDRVVIGTGAAGGSVILEDGTSPISTLSTASPAVVVFNAEIVSGTLTIINSGTANLTVTYR